MNAAAGLLLLVVGAGIVAPGDGGDPQDPASRRIEANPRIELRPLGSEPGQRPPSLPVPWAPRVDGAPDADTREHDRSLDIELDLKERRERMEPENVVAHYAAAVAIVLGSGIGLLWILAWAAKRRGR